MQTDSSPPDPGIRIAWWNTALAPSRTPLRVREEQYQAAAKVLVGLIEVADADVIVLGEMSGESVKALRAACPMARARYTWLPAFHRAGRSRFSVCVLSRRHRIRVDFESPIVQMDGNSAVKVGLHFSICQLDAGEWINLFVSHWPSRLHMDRHDSARTHMAAFFRHWIDDHLLMANPNSNIVLIGDFNDEPFDEGLERYLHASRDRERVKHNPMLLYNPFWRHLSSFRPGREAKHLSDPGTYFHRGGRESWWRTFDQLIVSSAVLFGRAGWRLNETHTRVADLSPLEIDVRSRHRFFDHLPIVGHLERQPT